MLRSRVTLGCLAVGILVGGSARADSFAILSVARMYQASDGFVYFGVTSPPPDVCNLYATEFKFDSTTTFGKGWFAILMGAKLSGKQIDLWYTPSGNGNTCASGANYAVVTALGLTYPP